MYLTTMYRAAQAIFYHYYSTDNDPQHHYCDPKWCKYFQDKDSYDHDERSIPRACLDVIRPAFDELCSMDALTRVVKGGSQNANETFHGVLWTLAPKHRYVSAIMLDIATGLAVIIYNDGYNKLSDLFQNLFASCGHYTEKGFDSLDSQRRHHRNKFLERRSKND
jgi:hypothetical protein